MKNVNDFLNRISECLNDPEFVKRFRESLEPKLKALDEEMTRQREAMILTPELLNRTYTL